MAVDITDRTDDWDRFVRGLHNLYSGPTAVVAGVQQGPQQDGIQVANYAGWNEFGIQRESTFTDASGATRTRRTAVPARPFMRLYFDNHYEQLARFAENALTQAVLGRVTGQQAFTAIGVYNQDGIRKQIQRSEDYAPNAPATIAIKGSDKPLIDHAILLANISFEMRR